MMLLRDRMQASAVLFASVPLEQRVGPANYWGLIPAVLAVRAAASISLQGLRLCGPLLFQFDDNNMLVSSSHVLNSVRHRATPQHLSSLAVFLRGFPIRRGNLQPGSVQENGDISRMRMHRLFRARFVPNFKHAYSIIIYQHFDIIRRHHPSLAPLPSARQRPMPRRTKKHS